MMAFRIAQLAVIVVSYTVPVDTEDLADISHHANLSATWFRSRSGLGSLISVTPLP